MKAAVALLYFLLSNQGYWFAQQEGTIRVTPAVGEVPAGSYLAWELVLDQLRVADGRTEPLKFDRPVTVKLKAPRVRVLTTFTFRYTWRDPARDGGEITRGEQPIHVFPTDLLAGAARRLGDRRLFVVGPPTGLATALEAAKVPFDRVDDVSRLRAAPKWVLILVAPDAIDASPFTQDPLLAHAEAGGGVFVFAQSKAKGLFGYPLSDRSVRGELRSLPSHPLLGELWPGAPVPIGADTRAAQLPSDEPALEVVYWPTGPLGGDKPAPAPIDALLVTKTIGQGRIVLCQLPFTDFQTDPRAVILLRNAIDYLVTRPEPTPAPSDRLQPKPQTPATVPTIQVLPGVNP